MAIGVPGRVEYSDAPESVWCSTNGSGEIRVEIRHQDAAAIIYTPVQALELAKVLTELAEGTEGFRIGDDGP